MARYRKKPVIIEAWQYSAATPPHDLPLWLQARINVFAAPKNGDVIYNRDSLGNRVMEIHTLEGVMTANEGDWIICGVKGEIYPCKPDIFAATYEIVEPVTDTSAMLIHGTHDFNETEFCARGCGATQVEVEDGLKPRECPGAPA